MAVQKSSRDLKSWAPNMSVRVWSALVAFPEISVLRLDVAVQSSRDDEVAQGLEFSVFWIGSSKHGFYQSISCLLHAFEENGVLDNSHLDDFSEAVSEPALAKGLEEVSVGDGKDWRVEGSKQVLVAIAVAASSRGWTSVNSTDNGGAKHNVWSSTVVKARCETSEISNDTAANNKYGFISLAAITFVVFQNLLHTSDVLVSFKSTVDELYEFNIVYFKVVIKLLAPVLIDGSVNRHHTTLQRLVKVSKI